MSITCYHRRRRPLTTALLLLVAAALLLAPVSAQVSTGKTDATPPAPVVVGSAAGGVPTDDGNSKNNKNNKGATDAAKMLLSVFSDDDTPAPSVFGTPYAALGLVGNTMYVVGGMTDPLNNKGATGQIYAIDVTVPQTAMKLNATAVGSLPSGAKFGNGCAVVKGTTMVVGGGQYESDDDQSASPLFTMGADGKWTKGSQSVAAVPRYHSACTWGRDGLFQLMYGGIDTGDASGIVQTIIPFTDQGLSAPRATTLIPAFAGTLVPVNGTALSVQGGIGGTPQVLSSSVGSPQLPYTVDIASGSTSKVLWMNQHRVLGLSFMFKGKYLIHLGGNMPSAKTQKDGSGPVLEYMDMTSSQYVGDPKFSNAWAGPTQIVAPTAYMQDGHIFILGGLVNEPKNVVRYVFFTIVCALRAHAFQQKKSNSNKYLRIIKVEDPGSGAGLNFTWVDSYTPSPNPVSFMGFSLWALVGMGFGALFLLALVGSGVSVLRSRARARAEEARLQRKAGVDYGARDEYTAAAHVSAATALPTKTAQVMVVSPQPTGMSSGSAYSSPPQHATYATTSPTGGMYQQQQPMQSHYTGGSYVSASSAYAPPPQQPMAPMPVYQQQQYGGYQQQQPQQPQYGGYQQQQQSQGGYYGQ
ncbi:hypothetical protein BC828DRAFT_390685 [Blastocladiella britannica]|nr:hypothetical protein BC828DRAFT_390685 [Blastocladiella britannica]